MSDIEAGKRNKILEAPSVMVGEFRNTGEKIREAHTRHGERIFQEVS